MDSPKLFGCGHTKGHETFLNLSKHKDNPEKTCLELEELAKLSSTSSCTHFALYAIDQLAHLISTHLDTTAKYALPIFGTFAARLADMPASQPLHSGYFETPQQCWSWLATKFDDHSAGWAYKASIFDGLGEMVRAYKGPYRETNFWEHFNYVTATVLSLVFDDDCKDDAAKQLLYSIAKNLVCVWRDLAFSHKNDLDVHRNYARISPHLLRLFLKLRLPAKLGLSFWKDGLIKLNLPQKDIDGEIAEAFYSIMAELQKIRVSNIYQMDSTWDSCFTVVMPFLRRQDMPAKRVDARDVNKKCSLALSPNQTAVTGKLLDICKESCSAFKVHIDDVYLTQNYPSLEKGKLIDKRVRLYPKVDMRTSVVSYATDKIQVTIPITTGKPKTLSSCKVIRGSNDGNGCTLVLWATKGIDDSWRNFVNSLTVIR